MVVPMSLPWTGQPSVDRSSTKLSNARWIGLGSVILATVLWGLSNVVILQVETVVAPLPLILVRFGLVALLTLPFVIHHRVDRRLVLGTLLSGAIIGMATVAQATALKTISVDQMAFISALYVVLTPVVMAVSHRRWPGWLVVISGLVSLCGVALLIGHIGLTLRSGTWWALGGAVGITLQIVVLGSIAPRISPMRLTAWQSLGATGALFIWFLFTGDGFKFSGLALHMWTWAIWGGIVYLAVGGGLVAFWLQAKGQRVMSPTASALAFNTEPLWTTLIAWLWLRETMSLIQIAGALLTVGSLSATTRFSENAKDTAVP